jgi:hypothetical protein
LEEILRSRLAIFLFAISPATAAIAQGPASKAPVGAAQVVQQVRDYRINHEDRIVRELVDFLAIPNVASDTVNIQKNAALLVQMLKARGIETQLLEISGRGPVVFGTLNTPGAGAR